MYNNLKKLMYKQASPKWIKLLQKGLLSPAARDRIAKLLDPGKFRFVRHLGRGQFSTADEVVGNIGGYQGHMVRKLPSHAYLAPNLAYKGLKEYVDKLNKILTQGGEAPAIAPYLSVGRKGAFQRFADQKRTLPANYKRYLGDVGESTSSGGRAHRHNISDSGQIIDFTPIIGLKPGSSLGWAPPSAKRISDDAISFAKRYTVPGGYDSLANITNFTPAQLRQNKRINDAIRKFYHSTIKDKLDIMGDKSIVTPKDVNIPQLMRWIARGRSVPKLSLLFPDSVGSAPVSIRRAVPRAGPRQNVSSVSDFSRESYSNLSS